MDGTGIAIRNFAIRSNLTSTDSDEKLVGEGGGGDGSKPRKNGFVRDKGSRLFASPKGFRMNSIKLGTGYDSEVKRNVDRLKRCFSRDWERFSRREQWREEERVFLFKVIPTDKYRS